MYIYSIFLLAFLLVNVNLFSTEVIIGSSQAPKDIFYNLESQSIVGEQDAKNWHLAFQYATRNAGIKINPNEGILCYYAGSDFEAALDTANISQWTRYINSDTSLHVGALNRNIDSWERQLFDYGWGVYNPSTHNLDGNAVFVLKFADGSFKKIFIVTRYSTPPLVGTIEIKVANLDNSDLKEYSLNTLLYSTKNYSYFSFTTGELFDREPVKTDYNLIFTRYQTYVTQGPQTIIQNVAGVLSNLNTRAIKIKTSEINGTPESADLSKKANIIGWDWKTYDYVNNVYTIEDNTYFVQKFDENTGSPIGDMYSIKFDSFNSPTGTISFTQNNTNTSVDKVSPDMNFSVYPNIINANQLINYVVSSKGGISVEIKLMDINGSIIESRNAILNGMDNFTFNSQNLSTGTYFITLQTGNETYTKRLFVTK